MYQTKEADVIVVIENCSLHTDATLVHDSVLEESNMHSSRGTKGETAGIEGPLAMKGPLAFD